MTSGKMCHSRMARALTLARTKSGHPGPLGTAISNPTADCAVLSNITQFQCATVTHEHLPAQSSVVCVTQSRVSSEQTLGAFSRFVEDRLIATQVGDSQRRQIADFRR